MVPTLGERRLGNLVRAIANECAATGVKAHAASPMVLHNGAASAELARICRASGVLYANHERRGYSEIRNQAIQRAIASASDVLVMIDDDELPVSGWLAALIAPFADGADVVVGPVATAWPDGAPNRYVRSDLPRAVTERGDGPIDADLRSGNCAVRISTIGSLRFDDRFNRTGGEDTAFFRQVRAGGARCFWAQAASVVELVDRERVSLRYFARRSFAQGHGLAAIRSSVPRSDDPPPAKLVRTCVTRAARLGRWTVTRRSLSHALEAACEVAFVAGFVAGQRTFR